MRALGGVGILVFEKILAHRSKGIEQRTGLQTNTSVHDFRFFIERIPRTHDVFFVADGEFKFPGKHIGQLLMRMVMQRAYGSLFKVHLYRHHFAIMGEDTTGDAVTQIFKGGLFMKNKHQAVL